MNSITPSDDHAPPYPTHASLAPEALPKPGDLKVLVFEPGADGLGSIGTAALMDWLSAWQYATPQGVVLMAHDLHGDAELRAARLRTLRDEIQALGVPRENIKYTDEPVRLSARARPEWAGAVVLKMIDPLGDGEVRTVASCFGALSSLN